MSPRFEGRDVALAAARLSRWYPLGHVGEPDDMAGAVAFLICEDAAFVNGAGLTVDGALTAGTYRLARELEAE